MPVPTLTQPPPSPLDRARHTLQQALQRYAGSRDGPSAAANAAERPQKPAEATASREQLEALYSRLTANTLRVAVFGLVSRGKSAVINALLGKPVLETGPLHGVTRWPRSVYWQPEGGVAGPAMQQVNQPTEANASDAFSPSAVETPADPSAGPQQIEFIDTPGLDEIAGAARAEMAQTVAQQADLILFVVAGEITQPEYEALLQLQAARKPLLLVFNKIDLYPEVDQDAIVQALELLRQQAAANLAHPSALSVDQVIRVAADPAAFQVRTEWPDGQSTYQWEKPEPQIEPLRSALSTLLYQDGAALMALNTLRQARDLETQLIRQVTAKHQEDADALIWRFARYKALAVALNPVAGLDLLGGMASDLVMIRALAKLYSFPVTNYQASQLWGVILRSSGLLLLAEITSGLLGASKSLSALFSVINSPVGLPALGGAMVLQATASGYGTYTVGQAAKRYLEQGCTWGPEGLSRVMQEVLETASTSETLARLRQDVQESLDQALTKHS